MCFDTCYIALTYNWGKFRFLLVTVENIFCLHFTVIVLHILYGALYDKCWKRFGVSVLYVTIIFCNFFLHFTVIKCYPFLLFEALVEAYSLPFSIACSLCLIFALATSWLEINGSAFFNYRGNWSCQRPQVQIGTLEATSWFTYQAFWLGEAIYLMSSRSEDNLVQRSVGSQAVKHLKCREWNMGGNRETVEQDEWDFRLGCFP